MIETSKQCGLPRALLDLAAAALALGLLCPARTFAADPGGTTCRNAVLGRLCTLTSQANPPSIYGQYGYAEIRAIPPASINGAIAKTLRKQPFDVVKRLFQDRTVAGVVTLKIVLIDGDKEKPIGVLPVATFSSTDKGGITVANTSLTTAGQSYFRATPYFKLDQGRFSVKAYISIHTTTDANSNIAKLVSGALPLVAPFFGVPGAVVSSLTEAGVVKKVSDFENQLLGTNQTMDPTEIVQLAFTADNAAEYSYEFDPRADTRSGLLAVRLRSTPSLFTEAVDVTGKPQFHVADLTVGVAANTILNYAYANDGSLGDALKGVAGQAYWDGFNTQFVSAPVYNPACTTVRNATLSPALGLTPVDAKALFWAAYANSQNAYNPDARATNCLVADAAAAGGDGFKRYGLDLPPVAAPAPSPGATGPRPDEGNGSTLPSTPTLSKLEYRKFAEALAFDLRQPKGMGDAATTKKALLGSIFAGAVGFVTTMDVDAFLPLDPSPVEQAKIVDVFAALPLKSGCFYRLPDQKTRFFARAIGNDGKPSEVLWHLTAATTTDGIASHTYINDLEVRPARSSDFAAEADILANRPACLDPQRSPE